MPTFAQIYDAYRASPASNKISLGEFAKLGEFYTGDPGFSTASGGLVDQGLKRGSYWLDKGVEATGAPQVAGDLGAGLFDALGLDAETGREVGRGLPRMAANLLPLAIPGVGPVAAIGGSAALSGVDAYEKSDSLGSAATAAASVPVSVLGAGLATQGLSKALGMTAPALAQTFLGRLGLYGAENVGATAAGEAFQVATGGEIPKFDREYFARTALESLPFAAADVKTLFTKPAMPTVPTPGATPAAARAEGLVSGSNIDTENVAAPAARPVNPIRASLDSVMEEFNLIDSQAELDRQVIVATIPEGAEREAALLKHNKRTRQKLMQIEEPEEAVTVEPVVGEETPVVAPPPAELPVNVVEPEPVVVQPELPTSAAAPAAEVSTVEGAVVPETVSPPVAAEPPAQVLTPPVEKIQVTAKAVAELNNVRMAAKLPPILIADARAALELQMKAFPEKGTRELMEDWLTSLMPRKPEMPERTQETLTDATRAGSVEVRNDPGKNKFTKAHDYAMREVEILSKADPKSEDGMLWAELGKVRPDLGIGWLSAPEELMYAKNKGRANEMSTAQKRSVSYLMASIMEAKRGNGWWRKGLKGEVNLNSLSPDALAKLIFEQASNRANSFKGKESFVSLDDPEINAARVEADISSDTSVLSPEERAAAEAINDALADADAEAATATTEKPTEKPKPEPVDPGKIQETNLMDDPLGLDKFVEDKTAELIAEARFAMAKAATPQLATLAWTTRLKQNFNSVEREAMAKALGVPVNKLGLKLAEGLEWARGSDGKIRALVPDALPAGGGSASSRFDSKAFEGIEGFKSRSKIIELPIDDFLRLAAPISEGLKNSAAGDALNAGTLLSSIPQLMIDDGVVIGHEGRNRAAALKALGYTTMPVELRDRKIRWDEVKQEDVPARLMAEGRSELITVDIDVASRYSVRGSDSRLGIEPEMLSDVGSPTFDSLFTQVMRKSGEHDDTIMAMLPKVREIGKLWNLDDVRFGELVNDVMGDAPVAGMATISGPVRKMWLAARNAGLGGANKVENLLAVAAHEAGHLAEQLYNSNSMREMDRAKYESAQRWKETATPEEMRETLEVAVDTLLPRKWRKLKEVRDMLTHTNKDEILASLHGVWAISKLENVKDLSLLGALMPAQPRGFFEVITRNARRAMRGLRGVFYGTKSHDAHSALKDLTKTFESIEWGIKKSNEDIAAARAFLDIGVDSFDEMRTSSLQVANDKSVPLSVNEFARLMAPESDVANRQGGVWKTAARAVANFIEPMSRVVEAHPKLKELGEALLNVSGDAHANLRRLMNPLYGDSDPVTGAHKSMPKEIREVMDIAHNDKDANKLINDVTLWEAANPGKRIDFSDASGPGRDLTRTWKELPEKKRNAVSDYIARAVASNREGQQMILEALDYAAARLIGKKIATRMPGLSDSAINIAQDQLTALQLAEAGLIDQALMLNQKVKEQIPDLAVWTGVLESAKTHYEGQKKLKEFFAQRPSFQSYMRIGDYVVDAFDSTGAQVRNALPAQNANEAARIEKLLQGQGLKTKVRQTTRGHRFGMSEDIQAALDAIDDRLMRKLNDAFGDRVSEAEFAQFKSEFSLSGQLQHSAEIHSKFNPTEMGRSLAGASGIDAVEQRRQSARVISNALAKMRAGSSFNYWKTHPKLRTMDMIPQVDKLAEAWRNYQIDDNTTAAGIAQFAGVYHLGFNLPNMVAETLQPFTTVLSQATAQHGAVAATKGIAGVLKDVAKYYAKRFAGITRANEEFSKWGDNDERLMLTTLRDQGYFSRTLYNEGLNVDGGTTLAKDLQSGKKPWGIGSMAQNLGNNVMRMYELFTRHNTRIASVLGYRLARKDGADHEAAVQAAKRFVEAGAYVGSRATRSLGLYGESTRGLGQLAHVLQGYNFSFLSQAARHLQRGWLMDNKQLESYGFTEADRFKAKQASLMLFGTQFAAAGALGLPFAGAMTALFEKMTGQDVKASLYQWFAQQFEDDQEQGGEAADMLMRGFANSVIAKAGLPIDLGGRFSVGGLPGMSEMSGFDAGSVFGPVGGLVKTAFGAGSRASQGDFAGAATDLLPPGIRKLFDLLQHGDMTDKNRNLMGLDETEKALYALGMTPNRVRKLRDFENMVDSISVARLRKTNKIEAELAEMLDEADPVTLRNALREKADELDMSPKALGAKVAALKLKMAMPKDFRSVPTAQDADAAGSLAAALGVSFGPSREREKAQLETQIRARLGLGPLGRDRMLEARRRERLATESPLDAYQSLP